MYVILSDVAVKCCKKGHLALCSLEQESTEGLYKYRLDTKRRYGKSIYLKVAITLSVSILHHTNIQINPELYPKFL